MADSSFSELKISRERNNCLRKQIPLRERLSVSATTDPMSEDFYQRYRLFESPLLNNNLRSSAIIKDLSTQGTIVFNPAVLNHVIEYNIGYTKDTSLRRDETPLTHDKFQNFADQADYEDEVSVTSQTPSTKVSPTPKCIHNPRFTSCLAVFVRLMLIGHNSVAVWRVTVAYNDDMYWLLLIVNLLLVAEGAAAMYWRRGIDYKWWCPCFLIYLASTLPVIWLLQLKQYDTVATGTSQLGSTVPISPVVDISPAMTDSFSPNESFTTVAVMASTTTANLTAMFAPYTTNETAFKNFTEGTPLNTRTTAVIDTIETGFMNITADILSTDDILANITTTWATANKTESTATAISISSTKNAQHIERNITTTSCPTESSAPDTEVWLIIVQESLVYLLVLSRWLLPRRKLSREFLADLLLEFLAIASDIMELLAVFDEAEVRSNLLLTYWILAVWSASFIQFIPVLAHKRMFRQLRRPQAKLFSRACGEYFVEIAYTCMSIFLQDGPFLILRLYIMITINLITYSLVFFVLKNIVSLLLLWYRLGIMCYRLPCCRRQRKAKADNDQKSYLNNKTDFVSKK